jgi:hypothetical protein
LRASANHQNRATNGFAFFSDEILKALDQAKVSYSISVPFERFIELKERIESQMNCKAIDHECDSFEIRWKPKKWTCKRRFVFIRQKVCLLSTLITHNLTRELQITTTDKTKRNNEKRPTPWAFERLDTLRRQLVQRAGQLIETGGRLTLSMSGNEAVRLKMKHYFNVLSCPN